MATPPKKKCTCSRCKKTMSEIKFYTHKDGSKDDMCKDCRNKKKGIQYNGRNLSNKK